MTDNHLLLYRLAELMFEHEQHILPVDLLFDDEQIGDFAKSIQIDSPYQQMLFEGVLTETVRDEKLYVSFTVEGYFHYVLGEVIYKRTEGLGAEALKQIVEKNKLNGAKEGVEQCLIRDVQNDELSRLMWMIDSDDLFGEICVYPILVSLKSRLAIKNNKSEESKVKELLKRLFSNKTKNDYKVIYEALVLAKKLDLHDLIKTITLSLVSYIKFDSPFAVELVAKSLEFLVVHKLRLKIIEQIIEWIQVNRPRGILLLELNSRIASTYEIFEVYDKAEEYYKKCLKFELKRFGYYHIYTSTSYNQLGLLKLKKIKTNSALHFFEKGFEIRSKIFDDSHFELTNSLHNIALTYQYQANYSKCIEQYELVLKRRLKFEGKKSESSILTISNLGIAYVQSKIDLSRGEELIKEALTLNNAVFGNPNIRNSNVYRYLAFAELQKENADLVFVENSLLEGLNINISLLGQNNVSTAYCFDDLCDFYFHNNELLKAKQFGEKAIPIYRKFLGDQHQFTKSILAKCSKINHQLNDF
jgi:tetratricopeptide (TPR) repeat protein